MKKASLILGLICFVSFANVAIAKNSEAQIIPEAVIETTEGDSSLLVFQSAAMKFVRKDFQGAIAEFDRAISFIPDNPQLYLNRGYVKQVINDLDGAMEDYNEAISLNKNYAFAYNNRGVLKVAMNDVNGAMEDYATAIRINPKYADVYYNRANLKYMLDDNQGALADYNIAIELNPKDSEAFNNRGVVKKRMNFNVGALSDYSQAIALNPKDSIAYANRGRLKKLYFDNEGAAIDLDQAIALAETQTFIKNVKPLLSNENYITAIPNVPGGVPSQNILAETKSNNNTLNKAYTKVSKNEESSLKLAYQTENKQNEINKGGEKPVSQNKQQEAVPAPPAGAISAGVAEVHLPEAPVITTKVVKNNPTTNVKLAESYYIRGLQKCVLKDLKGAIADLNKAIENNAKYADAYYYRAAIRKELGDTEGFRKDYSTAIQMNPSLQAFNDSNCLTLISG